MGPFRILLGILFATVVIYTVPVIQTEGLGLLFPQFFGDIAKMQWPGQFNLDFMGFLILSGTWMMWRNHFSPGGIVLGIFGLFGGIPLLTTYLFILSRRHDGDWATVVLGPDRAGVRA